MKPHAVNRRAFLRNAIKAGVVLGTFDIFVPELIRAATPAHLNPAFFRMPAPSTGGGGSLPWLTLVSIGTPRANFGGTVGCTFTVSSSITVTDLGCYVISGSAQTHRVGLWNSALTNLAEISVNKGTVGAGWNFAAVTPVVLTSGTYYLGEEEFNGGDAFYNDDSSVTTTSAATITFSSFQSGSYGAPRSNGGTSAVKCFGPVNFKSH